MSLPYLYKIPQDDDDWRSWAFNHGAIHFDWVPALQSQKKVTGLQQFYLSEIDPNDLGMWLYNHQVAHDQANAALGTTGYNLLSLDWRDPDQFAEWIRQNGDEHQRIGEALGLG